MSVAATSELPVAVSIAYQNWHRFSRNPTAVIGSIIVVIVLAAALLAPWIAPYLIKTGDNFFGSTNDR